MTLNLVDRIDELSVKIHLQLRIVLISFFANLRKPFNKTGTASSIFSRFSDSSFRIFRSFHSFILNSSHKIISWWPTYKVPEEGNDDFVATRCIPLVHAKRAQRPAGARDQKGYSLCQVQLVCASFLASDTDTRKIFVSNIRPSTSLTLNSARVLVGCIPITIISLLTTVK